MKLLRTLVAALFLVAQTGCAFGPRVETLVPGRHAALNERAARARARLVMRDGTQASARGLTIGEATASWTDADTGAPASAPLTEIAEVRLENTSGRAAAIGGGWGFLIGAILGAIGGIQSSSEDDGEFFDTTPFSGAVIGGVVAGTIGWLIGLPVGALKGADDIYRLPSPPESTPDRPLRGGSGTP